MKKNKKNKKILYRDHIVKALMTEPLKAGLFLDQPKCSVCAVGAVLRQCFKVEEDVDTFMDVGQQLTKHTAIPQYNFENKHFTDDVSRLIEDKLFLSALSVYFEGLVNPSYNNAKKDTKANSRNATDTERVMVAKFVYDNFPARFEVEW